MRLSINKRFANLLPPLTAEELERLKASILADGIRDPLVLWKDIIIDGHNRYDIATLYDLPFSTVGKSFADEDEACIWIIENQAGKRNLTDAQRTYQLGELYKLKKKKHGGDRKSDGAKSSGNSCHLEKDKTRSAVAKGQNVSERTVHNAADFHTAVNEVAANAGVDVNDVIGLAERTSKADIVKIAKLNPAQQKKAVVEGKSSKQIEIDTAQQKNKEQSVESMKHVPPLLYVGDGVDWIDRQEPCDLLLTDPPYMTDVEDIESFVLDWLPIALSKVKTTGFAFVFIGAYPDEVQAYLNAKSPPNVELCQLLVWTYKNTLGNNPKDRYKQNYQNILFYRGVDASNIDCPVTSEQWAVMDINAPDGRQGDRFHSWQKPMELAERLIRHTTKQGDTVYDPFACTGTFLLAANKLGRKGAGAEINEENAKIAIERGVKYG